MSDWREKVEGITTTNICPKCNKEAPFGAVFFVGVEGMVQECRDCRKDEPQTKSVTRRKKIQKGEQL